MEISTSSTPDLQQHLIEITVEQEHRRNTGEHGGANTYLDLMNDDTLRDHQLYVLREITRRDAKACHHAFFTK